VDAIVCLTCFSPLIGMYVFDILQNLSGCRYLDGALHLPSYGLVFADFKRESTGLCYLQQHTHTHTHTYYYGFHLCVSQTSLSRVSSRTMRMKNKTKGKTNSTKKTKNKGFVSRECRLTVNEKAVAQVMTLSLFW
jgi:hypothetical protein